MVEEISSKIENLVLKADFEKLSRRVMPEMNRFKGIITDFEKSQSQHHEILRRFDEVLLEKASKTSLQQVRID